MTSIRPRPSWLATLLTASLVVAGAVAAQRHGGSHVSVEGEAGAQADVRAMVFRYTDATYLNLPHPGLDAAMESMSRVVLDKPLASASVASIRAEANDASKTTNAEWRIGVLAQELRGASRPLRSRQRADDLRALNAYLKELLAQFESNPVEVSRSLAIAVTFAEMAGVQVNSRIYARSCTLVAEHWGERKQLSGLLALASRGPCPISGFAQELKLFRVSPSPDALFIAKWSGYQLESQQQCRDALVGPSASSTPSAFVGVAFSCKFLVGQGLSSDGSSALFGYLDLQSRYRGTISDWTNYNAKDLLFALILADWAEVPYRDVAGILKTGSSELPQNDLWFMDNARNIPSESYFQTYVRRLRLGCRRVDAPEFPAREMGPPEDVLFAEMQRDLLVACGLDPSVLTGAPELATSGAASVIDEWAVHEIRCIRGDQGRSASGHAQGGISDLGVGGTARDVVARIRLAEGCTEPLVSPRLARLLRQPDSE